MKRTDYNDMPLFGRRLMELRKARNFRQEDLAAALGVSRETISYYESRAKNPTAEFIQKVADFFDVPTDQFLREEPSGRQKPGPASKLELQLEKVRQLPPPKQKVISEMLDMVLKGELAVQG